MAWELDEYAQALLALAHSQPSNLPTPSSTPSAPSANSLFGPPPHIYSGQHVWGDQAYRTMQHQPLVHSTTANSTTGVTTRGVDDHDVGLDYYGNHGWGGEAQTALLSLPLVRPEPRTPMPTKKPRGSTTKAMQTNTKADENIFPPDVNLEDGGDPVDEVMQTTCWSADKKTLLFECILGPDSDNIFELLKIALKAAFEKASLNFVCEIHT
ncbi:uncharacterized protein F5147DRAFT_774097 [Suillus discolor]|uniref:Uncharacterized protein n=1 Tax=Suillus discolor TaxID=1912936 RepID=A0A9P7F569_9AGAM|nr:uncharacterized protein F5147DRAFT_774097 [Suillus discolor]KAG2107648.1 hypothetical protein F5147DRAFT_774097 [Suillus discolor]